MNYRHAYHAGNFADVVKHITLARIVSYLRRKDAAFRVLDTHAGVGVYDLDAGEARRTAEADVGIRKLLQAVLAPAVADLIAPYRDAVAELNAGAAITRYPGSPALARALLRPQDRLVANELHPADHAALAAHFARDPHAKVLNLDGWIALKSCLPPPERRGLILIDPPFEQPGEFDRMQQALVDGHRRFANGIFALWYPIKDPKDRANFLKSAAIAGFERAIAIELMIQGPTRRDVLNGAGLLVANPPFVLADEMRTIITGLLPILSQGPGASAQVFDCVA